MEKHEIVTSTPHFQCSACQAHFAFRIPQASADEAPQAQPELKSFLIEWRTMPAFIESHERAAPPAVPTEACPKCGFGNAVEAPECRKCGVILAKLRQRGQKEFRSTERVKAQWENILANYEEESRHELFVEYCRQDLCLPFAAHRYQAILDVDPTEEIAQKFKRQVTRLVEADFFTQQKKNLEKNWKALEWSRYLNWTSSVAVIAGTSLLQLIFKMGFFRSFGATLCLAGLWIAGRKLLDFDAD